MKKIIAVLIGLIWGSWLARPAIAAETSFFVHSDHLGSTSLITDGQGAVVQRQAYYPYGSTRNNYQAPNTNNQTERKYTGQISDQEQTGLYYYNARYYDPATALFTQADTEVGGNRYAYVNGNPIALKDVSGHRSQYCAPAVGQIGYQRTSTTGNFLTDLGQSLWCAGEYIVDNAGVTGTMVAGAVGFYYGGPQGAQFASSLASYLITGDEGNAAMIGMFPGWYTMPGYGTPGYNLRSIRNQQKSLAKSTPVEAMTDSELLNFLEGVQSSLKSERGLTRLEAYDENWLLNRQQTVNNYVVFARQRNATLYFDTPSSIFRARFGTQGDQMAAFIHTRINAAGQQVYQIYFRASRATVGLDTLLHEVGGHLVNRLQGITGLEDEIIANIIGGANLEGMTLNELMDLIMWSIGAARQPVIP